MFINMEQYIKGQIEGLEINCQWFMKKVLFIFGVEEQSLKRKKKISILLIPYIAKSS